MVSRITLIVAQRLSTVRNADMIGVIHGGEVVERGSHSELLKDPDGAYSQLIRLQEISKRLEKNSVFYHGNNPRSVPDLYGVPARTSILEAEPKKLDTPASETSKLPPEVPLYRLACLNKPEIPVFLLGAIASMANGVILPVFGTLLSIVIKTFYEPADQLRRDSKFWALMFVVLGVASLLATPLSAYFFAVAGCKSIKRIQLLCFQKVVHMEISWFDESDHSSGAMGSRLSTDAACVRMLVGDTLSLFVQNTATVCD